MIISKDILNMKYFYQLIKDGLHKLIQVHIEFLPVSTISSVLHKKSEGTKTQ